VLATSVDNTSVPWLRSMTSRYVGCGHQNGLPEVGEPRYLCLSIPWYIFGSANLVGHPRCVTSLRSVCFVRHLAMPVCSGHPRFCVRTEGLPEGCMPKRCCQASPGAWALIDLRPP
jgi:hypothetical protein